MNSVGFPAFEPRHILLVRADAIGDHVLSAGILPALKARFPKAKLSVACPENVLGVFAACPCVDAWIPFSPKRLHKQWWYRLAAFFRFRGLGADLVINTVFSRDSASDLLVRFAKGRYRVGHRGDLCNQKPKRKARNDRAYTHLIEGSEVPETELARHARLLRFFGAPAEPKPTLWISEQDQAWAEAQFRSHGIESGQALAFFGVPQYLFRMYPRYEAVLRAFLADHPARIVALGAGGDRARVQAWLDALPGEHLNLCGETSLVQAAALMARCRAGFGAETGLAQIAAAVELPHAIVLGGGHFGRFAPTSAHTHAACLPLDCYGCNWSCTRERTECIEDIPEALVLQALKEAWEGKVTGPSVLAPVETKPDIQPWLRESITWEWLGQDR